METNKRILGIFILLFSFSYANAQNGLGNWWIYFGNNKINKSLNWHNEIQYRNYNFIGDLEQFMLRTGLGYDLTPQNNNLLLGYGYIISEPYDEFGHKNRNTEHRIFGQFITKQNILRTYLQHRYRLEYRIPESNHSTMRARYFLAANIPLNNREMKPNTVYLSLYNEIFINFNASYYDRNRVYAALGYQINKDLKAEVGYMSQILPHTSSHQLQLVFFNNISFEKKG